MKPRDSGEREEVVDKGGGVGDGTGNSGVHFPDAAHPLSEISKRAHSSCPKASVLVFVLR